MKKLKAAINLPILATTALGMALLALGIGFLAPTGEQSKLEYEGDLWCVSNFIEKEPTEYLADGRPRQDPLLDSREDWIVRDQVKADTKEQAEEKARANGHGLFEPSNKDELRAKIAANDKEFFTTHFNTGATMAGPCLGTGSTTSQAGRWLNEVINQQCGFNNNSGYEEVSGKPTQAIITAYSPNMPGNTCDAKTGGPSSTADGGSFKVVNGRLRYVKGSTIEDYIFAQPSDNPIIAWNQIENQAVILDGFNNNQPIHIRDHYAPGLHAGQNYLDLFLPCSEYGSFNQGQTRKITVVDLTKPKSKITNTPNAKLPDGSKCPDSALPEGPSYGKDYSLEIAKQFQKALESSEEKNEEAQDNSYEGASYKVNSGDYSAGSNGVPLFRQFDPRWGSKSYGCGGTTIRTSGCGTTSAAMVLTYYGINVTPAEVTEFSLANGHRVCGSGTAPSLFPALAAKYGLKYKSVDWPEIQNALKNNMPVIAAMDDHEFSSGGHYIVLTGFDANGEILINDPGPRQISSASPNTVKARIKHAHLIYR